MKRNILLCLLLIIGYSQMNGQSKLLSGPVTVKKIWDSAAYNSFTDLIRFDNAFYCAFREGTSHVSSKNDGHLRILKSTDGTAWHSVALLKVKGLDLRDPKLSVTPDHRIMVTTAGAIFNAKLKAQKLFPMVSFSDNKGLHFSEPQAAKIDQVSDTSLNWIWRVTWHHGTGYGIDYHMKYADDPHATRSARLLLVQTKNGVNFTQIPGISADGFPNESTIRFNKSDEMFVLIRRDAGDKMGVLAKSAPPYHDWKYTKLDFQLGGPNFLVLKNNLIIATRQYSSPATTVLLLTDLQGKVVKKITLPSGGDTSYPGLVLYQHTLWVSYYSSHEGKASIYLAQIPM